MRSSLLGLTLSVCAAGQIALPPKAVTIADALTGVPLTVSVGRIEVGRTEVTQREYAALMGENPSFRKGADHPVENVSWWDAVRFCNRKSETAKLRPCYDVVTGQRDLSCTGYRLLTDAEWMYAAGAKHEGHLGPSQTKNSAELAEYVRTHSTRPVGQLKPNENGLFDMTGNVWEWIEGAAIRGGSFVSVTSNWARGYRSSMPPERRSRFTGFRICRTLESANPAGEMSRHGDRQTREPLLKKWNAILGRAACDTPKPRARVVATDEEPTYTGRMMYLQVEPDYEEKIYVMLPRDRDPARPLPVVVVPFYDVDTPVGRLMGGRNYTAPGTRSYAHLAVQAGFAAVAIRWFGESYMVRAHRKLSQTSECGIRT